MALISINLISRSKSPITTTNSRRSFISHLYYSNEYISYLSNPFKIKEIQFKSYKFEFSNRALPEFPISKINVITRNGIPILFKLSSCTADRGIRSYYFALNSKTAKLDNYYVDGTEFLVDLIGLKYYSSDTLSNILDKFPIFEADMRICKVNDVIDDLSITIMDNSKSNIESVESSNENILNELTNSAANTDYGSFDDKFQDFESQDTLLPEEETIKVEYDKIEQIVHTSKANRDPVMHIHSAYDLSVMNFKSWYDLQLNPKDHNSITIDKAHPECDDLISKPYYPLVAEDSVKPGIDFTTQYVHPSARKYLYNVNNPSYYYLYKESLTGSEFSELAKKLLYPHTFHEILTVNTDSNGYKEVIESEVPHDFKHFYEPFPSEAFIGISMNTGGIFYPFHLGLLSLLSEYNIVNINTPLLGTSAGSIAAGKLSTGMDFYESMAWAERVIGNFKDNGLLGRATEVIREALSEMFPYDAHQFLSNRIGKIYICYTLFKPLNKISHISHYFNKEDLIESILASSYIPKYSNKRWAIMHRGKYTLDGGFLPKVNTHKFPHSGSLRTVYTCPYFDSTIHNRCGFNNAISQFNYTKNENVELYLLLKSIQSRFMLIKYKLRDNLAEWKSFVEAIILYCEEGDIIPEPSRKIVEKYMSSDELELIGKILYDEQFLRNDEFVAQIGLIEWLEIQQDRIDLYNDIEFDKDMLNNMKNVLKSPEQPASLTAIKKLVSIISEFLIYVIPPMSLTYYYTNTSSILHVPYSFYDSWDIFLNGNTTEGTRSLFDRGRAAAYRWVILEYILMENYLYDKYRYYSHKLNESLDDNVTVGESQLDPPHQTFQKNQMYYISNIMKHLKANSNVEYIENINDHEDNVVNHLFVKRNNVVKKAIEIGLLENTDYTHILTHTHHWLNPH